MLDHVGLRGMSIGPLFVAVLLIAALAPSACRVRVDPPVVIKPAVEPGPLLVVGTLALVPTRPSSVAAGVAAEIELPDAEVFLRDPASNADVATARTQLDGKFHVLAPKPGTYLLCWKVQTLAGCGPRVVVKDQAVYVRTVQVLAESPVIHGEVLTRDGRPCWLHDPYFGLDVSTAVVVTDRGTGGVVRGDILANVSGEYAAIGLPAGRYRVHAECEKSNVDAQVSLGNASVRADLELPNRAPRIAAAAAFDSGRGVTRVAPGSVVQVELAVRDADQDPIEVLWRSVGGGGAISATAAPTQSWTLPSEPGLYSLYAMARDGRGGYAYQRFDLRAGGSDLGFSGRVIDETTQAPVAGASIEVGGVEVTTNAVGWFNLTVPASSPERYVLNVRHPEYALLSRIHDRSAAGNTYPLTRAQVRTLDPSQVIDLADTESAGPCGSPGGKGQRPPLLLTGGRRLDDSGRPVEDPKPYAEPCRHRGAHLVIPAKALVDGDGLPAQGPITATIATLDPARRSIPGDYQALDLGADRTELLSFGAVYAAFRDGGGRPLNLAPGTAAEIRVPVSDLQRPVASPQIALWSYDEKTGFWVEEGTADLTNTPEGWMYIGKTRHFSTINMDVAGNDPAFATCVRLQLDPSLSAWQNLTLRAYVSFGGTSVQVKETALDGAQFHAIYRIPFGNSFPPNTLRLELRGTFNGQQVVLLDDIINTDARPKMTGTDLWPPYPYTECGDPITLAAAPITLPAYGDIDATGRPAFLTGPYGAFLPVDGEQVATDYYDAIDPGTLKGTLGAWWTANSFAADGSGGTRAAYLNFNDLGFGRDMNCLQNGGDLACYVTNFGLPNQNPANADFAEVPQDLSQRGATVAMEYRASDPAAKRVQFYVYGGGNAAAPRIKFADLDGLGPKPVPHLCLVCHGGQFDTGDNKASHARFREFDLPSFKYSGGRSWDFGQVTLSNTELAAYATLNNRVRDIAPNPSPIRSLINAWYPGGFGGGPAPVQPAVPAGWSSQATGYHEVFAESCRTCHVARDDGAGEPFLTLNSSANFAGTSYVVCNSPKRMPNAFVTYKNFWNDPSRVLLYRALTGAATCQ
jgi:hypothetical protein